VKLGVTGAEILAPKFHAEAKARAEQLAPIIRELQGVILRPYLMKSGSSVGIQTGKSASYQTRSLWNAASAKKPISVSRNN
jgi:hypothetical protein